MTQKLNHNELVALVARQREEERVELREPLLHQIYPGFALIGSFRTWNAIKNQRKARNATSRGFGWFELVLYDIRELA